MPDPIPTPELTPEMAQTVSNAIVQSGASGLGPTAAPDPLSVSAHGGGDPSITFDYTVGSDGKIYGKGGTPPDGPTQNLTIKIRQFRGRWLVTSEMTQATTYGMQTTSIGTSGAQSNYQISDDQNIGWGDPNVRSSDVRNEERFEKFLPNDLLTGVRQSLWSLQKKKKLYEFDVEEPDPRLLAAAALMALGVVLTLASLAFGGGGTSTPSPSPSATAAPTVGEIASTFAGTTTTYVLNPPAPPGSTYRWSNTNPCGTQTGQNTATFVWDHPDVPGGCPKEAVHPANIAVVVSGPAGQGISRSYPGGSAPNVAVASTNNPAGGPVATATQIHATGEPLPFPSSGPNTPLLVVGITSFLSGGALAMSRARARSGLRRARSA